jgi:hypothetical protein
MMGRFVGGSFCQAHLGCILHKMKKKKDGGEAGLAVSGIMSNSQCDEARTSRRGKLWSHQWKLLVA